MPALKTAPIGWKVSHVKTPLGRWGTDVEFTASGRVLNFTGKISHARAVDQASKYLRDEATLNGTVRDVPDALVAVQRYLFRARDCEVAGDAWRAYNSAGLITERLVRAIQDGLL